MSWKINQILSPATTLNKRKVGIYQASLVEQPSAKWHCAMKYTDGFKYTEHFIRSATIPTSATDSVSQEGSGGPLPFSGPNVESLTGEQIISFATVDVPVLETVPLPTPVEAIALTNLEEGRDHSIKDVLSREYQFADGTIPVGGSIGQILQQWDVMSIFLSQSNVRSKISGFAYFRADLIVRLEFTTVPTNAGGIMISYYPDITPSALSTRITNRLQLSQVPNLQQSLTTAVSMKVKVPFISPFMARDLVNNRGTSGTLILSRLTPSSGVTVSYRAYISAVEESIHLQYPTTGEVFASQAQQEEEIERVLSRYMGEDQAGHHLLDIVRSHLRARSYQPLTPSISEIDESDMLPETQGILSNKSGGQESTKETKQGVISGILSTGSKIASIASGLPVIGGVASTVAPLLHMGSQIAGLLGLSKPSSDMPIKAIKFKPGDAHLTSEGVLPSHLFTVHYGTGVSSDSKPFGSELDEMSFEAVVRTPNIIAGFDITTAQAARHVLYQTHLSPYHFVNDDAGRIFPSHQFFVASLFSLWNSSLNFDFDVFLTHFHRVKLRFIVIPNVYLPDYTGTTLPITIDINKGTSAVVEFGGDSVNYSIKIDPRATTPMKRAPSSKVETAQTPGTSSRVVLESNLQTEATSYGTLLVIVEVPLKASPAVSSAVHCVTSFSCENFAVAYPVATSDWVPETQGSTSILGTDFVKESRSERMLHITPMSSNSVAIQQEENVKICAGDNALHFRNILNAFQCFGPRQTITPDAIYRLNAFIHRSRTTALLTTDVIDYVRSGYAFFKGGFNFRLALLDAPPTGVVGYCVLDNPLNPQMPGIVAAGTGIALVQAAAANRYNLRSGVRAIPLVGVEAVIDIAIPYYQQLHMVQNERTGIYTYGEVVPNILNLNVETEITVRPFRAVADDFRCGFLMSLPSFSPNGGGVFMQPT